MIRFLRPSRIIEIGSGSSTLLAGEALRTNAAEVSDYDCEHTVVDPHAALWLEELGINVIRQRVENLGAEFFDSLGENDVLFIDSSHIIRPQGNVLFLYLEVLPRLRPGVVTHVHDIFSPRDYKKSWIVQKKRFWNEQYLVEAFLSMNVGFEVLLAANYLAHHEPEIFGSRAPVFREQSSFREPGSLYIRRIGDGGLPRA